MTEDAFLAVKTLFSLVWTLMVNTYIPGTNINVGAWVFFSMFMYFCYGIYKKLLGSSSDVSGTARSVPDLHQRLGGPKR